MATNGNRKPISHNYYSSQWHTHTHHIYFGQSPFAHNHRINFDRFAIVQLINSGWPVTPTTGQGIFQFSLAIHRFFSALGRCDKTCTKTEIYENDISIIREQIEKKKTVVHRLRRAPSVFSMIDSLSATVTSRMARSSNGACKYCFCDGISFSMMSIP